MERSALTVTLMLLLAALPALAQSPDPGSAPKAGASKSDTPAKASPEKKKAKKVWTNDEISKVDGGVSVVGEASAAGSDTKKEPDGATGKDEFRQRQISNYKNQLGQLQSQIDVINKRITQLKNFKAESTGAAAGINVNHGYDMVPIPDQIKQLEDKKKQLQTKMDDLETEAHKNGITSDDLR